MNKYNRVIYYSDQLKLDDLTKNIIEFLDDNLVYDKNFKDTDDLVNYNGWLIFVNPKLGNCSPAIFLFNPQKGCFIFDIYNKKDENYPMTDKNRLEHYHKIIIEELVPSLSDILNSGVKPSNLIRSISLTKESNSDTKITENDSKQLIEVINNFFKDSEWKIECNKDMIFYLNPPKHKIKIGKKYVLTKNQEKIINLPPGHHRVRGVAGSGKTYVIAYRAAKLASQGYKVLITCYNLALWHFIKDIIDDSPYNFDWKNITLNHYHGFCRDLCNQYGVGWPDDKKGEDKFEKTIPDRIKYICQNYDIEKYDAIFIDEGQDFNYSVYEVLCNFLNERDELMVTCDKKQNLYEKNLDWLDKRKEKGLIKFGDWETLSTSVRLPRNIAIFANKFSEKFGLDQSVKIQYVTQPQLLYNTEIIKWINIENDKKYSEIFKAYELLSKRDKKSSIAILLPQEDLSGVVLYFENEKNIRVDCVSGQFLKINGKYLKDYKKRIFTKGTNKVKLTNIFSFKGWEADNIILFIPDKLDIWFNYEAIYCAITRTLKNLIVLNTHNDFIDYANCFSLDESEKDLNNTKIESIDINENEKNIKLEDLDKDELLEFIRKKAEETANKEQENISLKNKLSQTERKLMAGQSRFEENDIEKIRTIGVFGYTLISDKDIKGKIKSIMNNYGNECKDKDIILLVSKDYNKLENFNICELIDNNKFDALVIGVHPHKLKGTAKLEDYAKSSKFSNVKSECCRKENNELSPITKSGLELALTKLLNNPL